MESIARDVVKELAGSIERFEGANSLVKPAVLRIVHDQNLLDAWDSRFDGPNGVHNASRIRLGPDPNTGGADQLRRRGGFPVGSQFDGSRDLDGDVLPDTSSLEQNFIAVSEIKPGNLRRRFPCMSFAYALVGIIPGVA
jgi:hypothetical protein